LEEQRSVEEERVVASAAASAVSLAAAWPASCAAFSREILVLLSALEPGASAHGEQVPQQPQQPKQAMKPPQPLEQGLGAYGGAEGAGAGGNTGGARETRGLASKGESMGKKDGRGRGKEEREAQEREGDALDHLVRLLSAAATESVRAATVAATTVGTARALAPRGVGAEGRELRVGVGVGGGGGEEEVCGREGLVARMETGFDVQTTQGRAASTEALQEAGRSSEIPKPEQEEAGRSGEIPVRSGEIPREAGSSGETPKPGQELSRVRIPASKVTTEGAEEEGKGVGTGVGGEGQEEEEEGREGGEGGEGARVDMEEELAKALKSGLGWGGVERGGVHGGGEEAGELEWDLRFTQEFKEELFALRRQPILLRSTLVNLHRLARGETGRVIMKQLKGTPKQIPIYESPCKSFKDGPRFLWQYAVDCLWPRNPKPETRNPKFKNPKPETRNPEHETRNPKPESWKLKPETLDVLLVTP
jgi:hypothetical protein